MLCQRCTPTLGHTIVTRGTACVGAIVTNYLFTLVVPPEGTTCPARPLSFGPPGQARTSQTPDVWQRAEGLPAQ
jgi:hypothetical protein